MSSKMVLLKTLNDESSTTIISVNTRHIYLRRSVGTPSLYHVSVVELHLVQHTHTALVLSDTVTSNYCLPCTHVSIRSDHPRHCCTCPYSVPLESILMHSSKHQNNVCYFFLKTKWNWLTMKILEPKQRYDTTTWTTDTPVLLGISTTKKHWIVKRTRSTTLDLCVGFGSADVTTHAVLMTITNHSLLYRKMPIICSLQIHIVSFKTPSVVEKITTLAFIRNLLAFSENWSNNHSMLYRLWYSRICAEKGC